MHVVQNREEGKCVNGTRKKEQNTISPVNESESVRKSEKIHRKKELIVVANKAMINTKGKGLLKMQTLQERE